MAARMNWFFFDPSIGTQTMRNQCGLFELRPIAQDSRNFGNHFC